MAPRTSVLTLHGLRVRCLDRFTLIGTSMGGIIAMTFAMHHADRLAGLVLNDIGPDVESGS